MAQGTYSEIQKFARRNGCECSKPWSSEMNSTVDGFNRSPGADFGILNAIDSTGGILDFGITNASGYLDNKIRYLGVPRR